MTQFPRHVTLVEVGPRDGLQNEAQTVPTATKIDFIHHLANTGLRVIEATSFVSPKWISQLADNQAVYSGITKQPGVRYPVLIPNQQGLETALAAGVTDIAVFCTPSEAFSQRNTNCSVAESVQRIDAVMTMAKNISCACAVMYRAC